MTRPRACSASLSRRALGRVLVGALASACGAGSRATRGGSHARARGPVALWSSFDLPRHELTRELSAAAWDEARALLWSVQDEAPRLVALRPSTDLRRWRVELSLDVSADGPLDLEGVAILRDGFLIASEDGARILELDGRGALRRAHPVPSVFQSARPNKGLESLALSPDGRVIVTTSEAALAEDGPVATTRAGTLVRILRIDRETGATTQHAYLTDPAMGDGADHGVSDLAALSSRELLVLERGYCVGLGNRARVYRVTLEPPAERVQTPHVLFDRSPLEKALVVDVAALERTTAPLLANYEGLTVGPTLPDGRASLLLVSDDNARPEQIARVLVLAVG